jgi:hypothetical protein
VIERLRRRREVRASVRAREAWLDEVAAAIERGDARLGEERDIYELVAGCVDRSWERVADGTWTRPLAEEIRAAIRIDALRMRYQLQWGVSLAWVPAITPAGPRFHRTAKGARLALWEDGQYRDVQVRFTFHDNRCVYLPRDVEQAWRSGERQAGPMFDRAVSPEGVLAVAQDQIDHDDWARGVHFPSPRYVLAFTHARLGRADEARATFAAERDRFGEHLPKPERHQQALERVLADAGA